MQTLVPERTYVFFLKPNEAQRFVGVNPHEFALEIQHPASADVHGLPPETGLRLIARANTQSPRWCQLLVELYDAVQDESYFSDKLADSNVVLRGYSIVALCSQAGTNALIHENAVAYLQMVATREDLWPLRRKIAKCLKEAMGHGQLPKQVLGQWLQSSVPELQEAALEVLRVRKDPAFVDGIVILMENTADRRLQYECIKALSAIDGRSGPSYRAFMENAENIVTEERQRASRRTSPPVTPPAE